SSHDLQFILPVLVILILTLLILLFKNIKIVFITLTMTLLTILTTFGFEGLLALKFNNLTSAIIAAIFAVGLADAIHLLIKYNNTLNKGASQKEALYHSMNVNFIPTVLTTLTTAVGFLGLSLSDVVPVRDLGTLSAIGVVLAWIYTYFLIMPSILLVKPKPSSSESANIITQNLTLAYIMLLQKTAKYVVALFFIFTIVFFTLGLKLEINSDPIAFFDSKVPVRQDFAFFKEKFKTELVAQLIIDSNKKEGIKDPIWLKKVDQFVEWIKQKDYVVEVITINHTIKKMNKTLHNDSAEFYRIPDTRRAVSDILFLYTIGLPPGMDIKNLMTVDNKSIKASILWTLTSTKDRIIAMDEILSKAEEMNITVTQGGAQTIYNHINHQIVGVFFRSMSMAFLFVGFILFFVFRNVKMSVIAILPNIVPLILGAGLMQILNIEINIGTAIVCSVCLGIAVDDTIHFITNFQRERTKKHSVKQALFLTLNDTGKALSYTTILLVMGFATFAFGDFIPNRYFGILCSAILSMALITDVVLLPSILILTDKHKRPTG
ncbi:MMPL family transporter, partial [Bacteriovoracaceae bacterium]|nr:MMPL family transporter [Bacteriovoracaceae bacterium]